MDFEKFSKTLEEIDLPVRTKALRVVDTIDIVLSLKEKNEIGEESIIVRIEVLYDLENELYFAFVFPSPIDEGKNLSLKVIKQKFNKTHPVGISHSSPEEAFKNALQQLKKRLKKLNLLP